MTDEQLFFAWLDGELDAEAAARMEKRVADDPELARQAREHRQLGEQLRGAFAPLMSTPIPDAIGAAPVDFAAARERRQVRRSSLPQWAAIAATLVLGIGLGNVIGERGGREPVRIEDGRVVASAELGRALDTQLASLPTKGEATRVALTFRNKDGAMCRSFEGSAGSGLACRDGKAWRIEGLYGANPPASADYRMASGPDPRLAELIDSTIAGEPLDAAGERAAKAKGWR